MKTSHFAKYYMGGQAQCMHIISRRKLKEAAQRHPNAESALDVWFRTAKKQAWTNIEQVRRTYPPADPVGEYTVFNIKGNSYRLIVRIDYCGQRIFIKDFLTHAEYDKGKWKL